jgi:hypothetical protein
MRNFRPIRARAVAATMVSLPARAQAPAGWNDFTKLFQSYANNDRVVGASVVVLL